LAECGWTALAGTELEFILFRDTYEEAWTKAYRGLTPANLYNVDYSLLGTARVEPLLRRIRNEMAGAGLVPESAKGECNLGQHEIAFKYSDALTTSDRHVIFKTGAKEIAAQEGFSLTFMAKFDAREGNSCHIHISVRDQEGEPVFTSDDAGLPGGVFGGFMAGLLATMREMTLLFAPNVNSYQRYSAGSFAPTAIAWGHDNRTCALRVVGHGGSLRVENRVPGGDVNPYLALAALVAGGLHGIDKGLTLEPEFVGNAYGAADLPRVPATLAEATELFDRSEVARFALGDDVVNHYTNMARIELAAFQSSVTDWERFRGFERL
jgi:glutamine synthetase